VHRPTMADVAQLAGVSKATVSLVISGRAASSPIRISQETQERVLAAARQLGYSVNVIARNMSAERTHTLGLVTHDFVEYGPATILASAQAAARAHEHFLMVAGTELGADAIYEQIMRLDSWRVDGIFVAIPMMGEWHQALIQRLQLHIPVVWLEGAALSAGINSVGVDNVRGGKLAVEHLVALGHRRIGLIAGPHHWLAAQHRLLGWQRAMAAAGIGPADAAVAEGDWTTPGGYRAAHTLLDRCPDLTAIVAHNDNMALGAIRALRERGLRVPTDVSVVGYDDIPSAPYLDPPLTTVRQNLARVGQVAVDLLIQAGHDPALIRQETVTPELIVRESSAYPAGAARA